jgi:glycosyltransferase involved in cell wall biosynthesis
MKRGRRDVVVVIIGDGKERGLLEDLSRSLKLDNIHFLGLIPKLEVMRWLLSSHISLLTVKQLPYLDTASPNKLFDAFAAGVPTVQNTQGWIKDLLEKENCGLTVPHDNQSAMADAVLKILDDPELWKQMSARSKALANTYFDREQLSRKMLDAIRETLAQ